MQIYCDGACEPNPGNAGSGIVVYRDGKLAQLWYGLYNPNGTNNTAELNALHQALLIAEADIAAGQSVQILCDSTYAINCISKWAAGWEKKGWRKADGEIKNLSIIQAAYAVYCRIEAQLQLTHVSAHVGTEGNELADRMAMYAVEQSQSTPAPVRRRDGYQGILRMRRGLGRAHSARSLQLSRRGSFSSSAAPVWAFPVADVLPHRLEIRSSTGAPARTVPGP